MALIRVDEPFAQAPKKTASRSLPPWAGDVESSGGFAELTAASIDSSEVDLFDVDRLEIEGCYLRASTLDNVSVDLETSIIDTVVERCDLSRHRLPVVRRSRFVGVKLTGADFSGGLVRDVEFVDCLFRLSSFRMAELERVSFTNCLIDDVDAYSAQLTDITFTESRLTALNLDKSTASGVDLRHAELDGLAGLGRLEGFLISEHQLPALAYQLADAVGLSIEES